MDKKVGSRVKILAKIKHIGSDVNGIGRILLEDVYVDDALWRDHAWIKISNRTKHLKVGDVFSASALVIEYLNIDDFSVSKYGFKTVRAVEIIND